MKPRYRKPPPVHERVCVRIPATSTGLLDELGETYGFTRSEVIRRVLQIGLEVLRDQKHADKLMRLNFGGLS